VGHCVNFLPLRARVESAQTVASFLGQVRPTLFAAYDHQNYTYGRLVRKLNLPARSWPVTATEIQFNLEKVGEGVRFDGLSRNRSNPKAFVNFDIFLNVVETKDGLKLDCDYNTGLYDEATIARWLDHYECCSMGWWPIPTAWFPGCRCSPNRKRDASCSNGMTRPGRSRAI